MFSPSRYLRAWKAFRAASRSAGVSTLANLRWMPAWARSQRKSASSMKDESPWMVFAAIDRLRRHLRPDMRVFEWGSGGSTLFFARRAGQVIAVEHDEKWAAQVREACAGHSHGHVMVDFIPPDATPPAVTFDPADPSHAYSSAKAYHGLSFQHYTERILAFPDAHFHVVVVDGRARPACLRHALPKVKPGGLLVLDNSNRPHYRTARALVVSAGWKEEELFGPGPYLSFFWQSTIWQRPA
jgi:hypothetical protein